MPSDDVPELDIACVSASYRRRVEDACPDALPLAMTLFERLDPGRWTLEWHLPWWLGHAFGLDIEIAHELVLSNVLGLASIRLGDDLVDGDIGADDISTAKTLSAALYRQAVAPYRARFSAASPFWRHLDSCMAVWRAATHGMSLPGTAPGGDPGEHDSGRLAARGAPLKISAFAVCLLTDRPEAFPVLDRCLDHALAGLVLYDDLGDWQADLAAGRWNAFVAGASDHPQEPGYRDRNRSSVLLAMMTQDAVTTYVVRITKEMTLAAALAESLGSAPLAEHLRRSAALTEGQGSALQAHYRDIAERAGRLLLGAPVHARSRDGQFAAAVPGTG